MALMNAVDVDNDNDVDIVFGGAMLDFPLYEDPTTQKYTLAVGVLLKNSFIQTVPSSSTSAERPLNDYFAPSSTRTENMDTGGSGVPLLYIPRNLEWYGVTYLATQGTVKMYSKDREAGDDIHWADFGITQTGFYLDDANGDGEHDRLWVETGPYTLEFNGGQPTAPSTTLAKNIEAFTVGPLDGDDVHDVVYAACANGGTECAVYIFLGTPLDSTGTNPVFSTPDPDAHMHELKSDIDYDGFGFVRIVDVDGDGSPDIVATHKSQPSFLFYQNKRSTISASYDNSLKIPDFLEAVEVVLPRGGLAGGVILSIASGDLNGDGKQEVVVSLQDGDYQAADVFVYDKNTGTLKGKTLCLVDMTLSPVHQNMLVDGTQSPLTQSMLVSVGDIDGDGNGDVVVTGTNSRVSFFRSLGGTPSQWISSTDAELKTNHFTETLFGIDLFLDQPIIQLEMVDYDEDGDTDLSLIYSFSSSHKRFQLYINRRVWEEPKPDCGFKEFSLEDGVDSPAASGWELETIQLPGYTETTTETVRGDDVVETSVINIDNRVEANGLTASGGHVKAVDLDSDGDNDVLYLLSDTPGPGVAIFENNYGKLEDFPDTASPTDLYVPGTPNAMDVGDFTNDDKPDIVVSYTIGSSYSLKLYTNVHASGSIRASSFVASAAITGPSSPILVMLAVDVNKDGKLDVLVESGETSYQWGVFAGDGSGGFTYADRAITCDRCAPEVLLMHSINSDSPMVNANNGEMNSIPDLVKDSPTIDIEFAGKHLYTYIHIHTLTY